MGNRRNHEIRDVDIGPDGQGGGFGHGNVRQSELRIYARARAYRTHSSPGHCVKSGDLKITQHL